MTAIRLFYLSDVKFGGWVTFTAHLAKSLGIKHVYKIKKKMEKDFRPFGQGLLCQNVDLSCALSMPGIKLIVCASRQYAQVSSELIKKNAWFVIHDPTELKYTFPLSSRRCIIIRDSMFKFVPKATYIRHPYVPAYQETGPWQNRANAVCTSRIDFDKHQELILEANRSLPKKKQVGLIGFPNTMYVHHKLMPKYPEAEPLLKSKGFKNEFGGGAHLSRNYRYMVDMSAIQGDGGGTQYTFLEAFDGGAICVLNEKWNLKGGKMKHGKNCLFVKDPTGLVRVLESEDAREEIREAARAILKEHDPKIIAQQILSTLGVE